MGAEAMEPKVVFLPEEKEAPLDSGMSLLGHARLAGVDLASPCGGEGRCGKCRVTVSGTTGGGADLDLLDPAAIARGVRLACLCHPIGREVRVTVPESSRPARLAAFLDGRETEGRGPFEPRAGRCLDAGLGVALDLGTSTLEGALVDLRDGRVVARASAANPQESCGADLAARLHFVERSPGGADRLCEELVKGTDEVIASLLSASEAPRGARVGEVVVAGNPVISCLLHGIDPSPFRSSSAAPVATAFPERSGAQLGSSLARQAGWRTFPALGGWVGGGVVAGLLASGIPRGVEPALFFDLGTNGEVVLGSRDFLIACRTSAGPVFEGGEARCGARAVSGAIDSVWIDGHSLRPRFTTIGGGKAVGLCGSGIIDLVAELSRVGLIDRAGRFLPRPGAVFRATDRGAGFQVAGEAQSSSGQDLVITEDDIKIVLRTKAALCAAGEALLAAVGLERRAVRKVFIAGGFGNFLDVRAAMRLGVFPPFPLKRLIPLGNASLAGALAVLRAPSRMAEAEAAARAATCHDLAVDSRFRDFHARAVFIPTDDADPGRGAANEENDP